MCSQMAQVIASLLQTVDGLSSQLGVNDLVGGGSDPMMARLVTVTAITFMLVTLLMLSTTQPFSTPTLSWIGRELIVSPCSCGQLTVW